MRALDVIDIILEANQNLATKKVGVELELIVLRKYRKEFVRLARKLNFHIGSDFSIEKRDDSFEELYGQVEIDIGNRPWTQIERSLTALTSWLKREVAITIKKKNRVVYLPVGKVPQTMQAGFHIHFDMDWFDSPEHFGLFIKNANKFLKHDMEDMVAGQRYFTRMDAGSQFAAPDQIPEPDKKAFSRFRSIDGERIGNAWGKHGVQSGVMDMDSPKSFAKWWAGEVDLDREKAINLVASWDHGTIEFRFPNSTLNISTISGWVEFMAELIDHSRQKSYDQFKWATRRGERKHIGQFMDRRRAAYGHPFRTPPWEKRDYAPPRSLRRAGYS